MMRSTSSVYFLEHQLLHSQIIEQCLMLDAYVTVRPQEEGVSHMRTKADNGRGRKNKFFRTPFMGCRRSRVVTYALSAIRLRGPGFKPRPGQKFENEHFCFRCTPAVVKAWVYYKGAVEKAPMKRASV